MSSLGRNQLLVTLGVLGVTGWILYRYMKRNDWAKRYHSSYIPRSQSDLIDFLHYHRRMVFHPKVIETLKYVDRALFLSREIKDERPYSDDPKPIGFNATISAPHMHALGLDFLGPFVKEGGKALDIGSGSGYVSACLAHMMGPSGKVVGVEHIPELVEISKKNISSLDPNLLKSIDFKLTDGLEGWKEHQYDVIYSGAAAPSVPPELVNQLKPGGRMVIPVGPEHLFHELLIIDKSATDSKITIKSAGVVRFVPLTTKEKQLSPASTPNVTKVHTIEGQKTLVRVELIPAPDTKNIKQMEQDLNKKIQLK